MVSVSGMAGTFGWRGSADGSEPCPVMPDIPANAADTLQAHQRVPQTSGAVQIPGRAAARGVAGQAGGRRPLGSCAQRIPHPTTGATQRAAPNDTRPTNPTSNDRRRPTSAALRAPPYDRRPTAGAVTTSGRPPAGSGEGYLGGEFAEAGPAAIGLGQHPDTVREQRHRVLHVGRDGAVASDDGPPVRELDRVR